MDMCARHPRRTAVAVVHSPLGSLPPFPQNWAATSTSPDTLRTASWSEWMTALMAHYTQYDVMSVNCRSYGRQQRKHACNACCAHLEEVCEGKLVIVGRFGNGSPHLPQIFLPGLNEARQRRSRAVPKDKQQHCPPFVGRWCEQLQIDLHGNCKSACMSSD